MIGLSGLLPYTGIIKVSVINLWGKGEDRQTVGFELEGGGMEGGRREVPCTHKMHVLHFLLLNLYGPLV